MEAEKLPLSILNTLFIIDNYLVCLEDISINETLLQNNKQNVCWFQAYDFKLQK